MLNSLMQYYSRSIKTPKRRGSTSTSALLLIGSHSGDQTNFEVRGTSRKGGNVGHGDPALTLGRSDSEAVSKAGQKEKGGLST